MGRLVSKRARIGKAEDKERIRVGGVCRNTVKGKSLKVRSNLFGSRPPMSSPPNTFRSTIRHWASSAHARRIGNTKTYLI